jgi:superfamily II DNA/RNA helicase
MTFEFLGLSQKLLDALASAGYETPTPIQKAAIPAVLMGRDVLGIAQTGTGKTAGFTLPMIDILAEGTTKARMPRSLILEPTRELAVQIEESFKKYGQNHKFTTALLIGGTSMDDQVSKLDSGVDVLIATPGRLLDHFGRGNVMLNGIEILVIDESDRMLDMGFIPDVEKIRKLIPKKPQTLFFSATMPPEIKKLTEMFLTDPKVIQVTPPTTAAETVLQSYVQVGLRDKQRALEKILRNPEVTSALIFCNRKLDVTAVYRTLKKDGFDASELHGDMPQTTRLEVLYAFKAGDIRFLVASDVAARGLDIPDVSHVINFDMPQSVEDYIHRIGRTGRAGKEGHTILLMSSRDREMLDRIEAATKVKITPMGGAAPVPTPRQAPKAETEAEDTAPIPAHVRHDLPGQHAFPQAAERQSFRPEGEPHGFRPEGERHGFPRDGEQRGRRRRGRRGGRGRGHEGRPAHQGGTHQGGTHQGGTHQGGAHQGGANMGGQRNDQRPQSQPPVHTDAQPKPQHQPAHQPAHGHQPRPHQPQHQPSQPHTHQPKPQHHQPPRRDSHDRDDDKTPATFGDNVPAFLRASTSGRK